MSSIDFLTDIRAKLNFLEYGNHVGMKNLKLEMKTTFKKILGKEDADELILSIDQTDFYVQFYFEDPNENEKKEQWTNGRNELIGIVDVAINIVSIDDSLPSKTQIDSNSSLLGNKKVFVVHGHDDSMKLAVKDFLTKLNLEPIILHERTDEGNTIIEKFEREAENVSYAVILLSPDDVGKSVQSDTIRPRARQNVILELGFFTGSLGRNRTFNLVKSTKDEEIEQPNDISGVIYHEFDDAGGWKIKLAQSLKNSNFDVDLNDMIN